MGKHTEYVGLKIKQGTVKILMNGDILTRNGKIWDDESSKYIVFKAYDRGIRKTFAKTDVTVLKETGRHNEYSISYVTGTLREAYLYIVEIKERDLNV